MVAMYLGCYEIVGIVRAYMKAANAAQTLAELAASDLTANINNSDMVNYCNGAKLVMSPLSVTGTRFKAAIASVTRNSSSSTTQDWQDTANCGTASTIASTPSLVSSVLTVNGYSVIIVQVTYSYASPIAYFLPSATTITRMAFSRPRKGSKITHNNSSS
jgi:hypothetical protein